MSDNSEDEDKESLYIEFNDYLTNESFKTMLEERKNSLKCLHVEDGYNLNDTSLKYLRICQQLEELSIRYACNMGKSGVASLSQLSKLRILTLNNAQELNEDHFISLFSNRNLENLEQLKLHRCVSLKEKAMQTIALNCPKLKYLDLNECFHISNQGIKFLIEHLPKLCYLNVYDCWKIKNSYLKEVIKESKIDLEIVNRKGGSIMFDIASKQYSCNYADDDGSESDENQSLLKASRTAGFGILEVHVCAPVNDGGLDAEASDDS